MKSKIALFIALIFLLVACESQSTAKRKKPMMKSLIWVTYPEKKNEHIGFNKEADLICINKKQIEFYRKDESYYRSEP